MRKEYLFAALAAVSFLFGSCDNGKKESGAMDVVGKYVIHFNEPPKNIPSTVSVDAPLLGNGFTGVAIAGGPDSTVFYVARNDFWRLKSGYAEPSPLVLGKVELTVPELEGGSYSIEQCLADATTSARFTKGDLLFSYKTYVSATEDMMVLEMRMTGRKELSVDMKLSPVGEKEFSRRNTEEEECIHLGEIDCGVTEDGIHYLSRAFSDSVDIPTKSAMAMKPGGDNSGKLVLKEGETQRVLLAFSGNFKSDDCVKAVIEKVKAKDDSALKTMASEHKAWWKNYWEKSYVCLPDSVIEKQYYLSLYGIASSSRDLNFPPGIFGTWVTREYPSWGADYHLNYNHMAPYYGLYSSNRIEQADPYYAPLLAFMQRGKYYSEKVASIPDGILLPVGIGPLGIESTNRNHLMDKYHYDWMIRSGNVEGGGLFWGQKSNAAYAVVNLSMQFYHTWDKAFTEKVYPFVKAVATFWEHYLTKEGDRYVIYNDAIHEGTVGDKNPVLSLGLVRMVMQTAIDMSEYLGVDSDKRDVWAERQAHLSDYPLQERDGRTVFRYTEDGYSWCDGNTLGIQHIYPVGQIGLESDPKLLKVAYNTLDVMQRWLDTNGSNSFFPAAVRIGYNPDTILMRLNEYSRHTYPNGFQLNNPHGVENLSTVPNTINEMLCMGHQDIVRVFHIWPKDLDASFHNIRVEGAFLVSSELKGGNVTFLTLKSEKGRSLTLQNPWKGEKVEVRSGTSGKNIMEGEFISMETEPGQTYEFAPVE